MDLASILNNSDPRELIKRGNEVDPELLNRYVQNRNINEPEFSSFIVAYSILIVVGALGNTLVVSILHILNLSYARNKRKEYLFLNKLKTFHPLYCNLVC